MFDTIQCDAVRCPLCGAEMDWQSKDGPCTLETLTVYELMDETSKPTFYSSCDDCKVWVEVTVVRRTGRTDAQREQHNKERAIIDRKKAAPLGPPKDPHHLRGFLDYAPPADAPPPGVPEPADAEDQLDLDACHISGCRCGRRDG
jgi:hypothetical protein